MGRLDDITVKDYIIKYAKKVYEIVWKPLLDGNSENTLKKFQQHGYGVTRQRKFS